MAEEKTSPGKLEKVRILTNALTNKSICDAISKYDPYLWDIFEKAIEQEVEKLFNNTTDTVLAEGINACHTKIMQITNSPIIQVLERLLHNLKPTGVPQQQEQVAYTNQSGPRGANGISGF